MWKCLINNIDYIDKVKKDTLNINLDLDDYKISLDLILTLQEYLNLEVGAEIVIKENDNIVCGGIIYTIGYQKLKDNKILCKIDTVSYSNLLSRIVAVPFNEIEITDADLNKAENLYLNYYNKYLKSYGITIGRIKTNLTISEIELDEEEKTLKEIFDKIGDLTKTEYNITANKEFIVYKGNPLSKQWDNIINGDNLMNLEVEKTLEDYRNKYKIIGGIPEDTTGIPDDNIDEDGKIYVEVQNIEEQNRIKDLIGGDGVFSIVETNDKLQSIEELKSYADLIINKWGKPPIIIKFKLLNGSIYKPGDFIKVSIPSLNLIDQWFCIDSIDIEEEFGAKEILKYDFSCSMRLDNMARENLFDVISKPGTITNNGNSNNPDGIFLDSIDVQIANTISVSTEITFSDEE